MKAPPEGASSPGRRDASRMRTWAELRSAALEEVREHGAVALSLRRVARRMGMSPAGLYRYVASREDLLTILITDAFDSLADHLEAAASAGEDPHDDAVARLRAVGLAYRSWGVKHPQEFGLVFGDPLPGYVAPEDGPTVRAMGRVGAALGEPLRTAWEQGRLRPAIPALPAELTGRLAPMAKITGDPGRHELAVALLITWGRLHGQVSLEVFGQHAWLFPDGCEALFRMDLEAMLRDLGLVRPG